MDSRVSEVRFGQFSLQLERRKLLASGNPAKLGARAFDVLLALIERRDRVVSKHELIDLVWPDVVVEENNLQVQISTLRKLLGPATIATVPGRGYQFTAEIESLESTAPAPADQPEKSDAESQSSLQTSLQTNLPAHLPPIIGREDDVRTVCNLLRQNPLVTVVGAGGMGKTRLALAVADAVRGSFPNGLWWVELAATSDSAMVANAVAQTLGIAITPERSAGAALLSVLRTQPALLILDNCEQVLDAVAQLLAALLRECAGLRVLVTSQESLKLPDEHAYRVSSLAVPALGEPVRAEVGAVALFVERARAADPRLQFDDAKLSNVAAICRALDGIPLAIELAAARVPLLGIDGLCQRLNERLRLLSGGVRMALRRHQTLRAALEWSHGLLSAEEQIVFRRLGVFAGSFPLELAQALAADERIDRWAVLDLLGNLVDKSLVVADPDPIPRYRLLETTRAFALEQLAGAGETDALLRRHAQSLLEYLTDLQVRHWTFGIGEHSRAHAELDNLRAALDWAEAQPSERALAYALLGQSRLVWHQSGQLLEGIDRCLRLYPIESGLAREVEARFSLVHAQLGYLGGRADCFAAAGRAIELMRELDNPSALADALLARAIVGSRRGDRLLVTSALEEAAALVAERAPTMQRATLALAQAMCHLMHGRYEEAIAAGLRQVDCYRESDSAIGVQIGLANVGAWECWLGRYDIAIERLESALAELRRLRSRNGIAMTIGYLAVAFALRDSPGDFEQALARTRETLPEMRRLQRADWLLLAIALAYSRHGRGDHAARLVGYTDACHAREGVVLWAHMTRLRNEVVTRITGALGAATVQELMARGATLNEEQAFALLLDPH